MTHAYTPLSRARQDVAVLFLQSLRWTLARAAAAAARSSRSASESTLLASSALAEGDGAAT